MNVSLIAAFGKAALNLARPARFVQNDVVRKHGNPLAHVGLIVSSAASELVTAIAPADEPGTTPAAMISPF